MIADTDVSNCLATLLGTEVATRETPANKPAIALTQPGLAAIYIDDEKKVRGVCLCDVPVAAYSGAAMTLVGVEAADDCARSGVLSPSLAENFQEVLNVMSVLFAAVIHKRVRLVATYEHAKVPDAVKRVLTTAKQHTEFSVDVARYGRGQIGIYAW